MSNTPLISVIVPVYKVERYLPRCIESILRQTYTNFELILVDDGTPDRSGIICDRYAEKDSRIKVIHKENGGVSSARNVGIDMARGEWITFVDSDDWVTSDYLEVLVTPLNCKYYDLVVGLLELRSIQVVQTRGNTGEVNLCHMGAAEMLETVNKMEFCGPCHKLFSKKMINESNLRFPKDIAIAEDTIFVNRYLSCCKRIYETGKIIYYYNRSNEHSVTKNYPYFEERPSWDQVFIDSYIYMLQAHGLDESIIKTIVVNKTLDMFCPATRTIIFSFNEREAKEKILESIKYYNDKITLSDKSCLLKKSNEEYRDIITYICENNVDAIYDMLNHKKYNHIKTFIRRAIKKALLPFIEKYRDGLIKFKF